MQLRQPMTTMRESRMSRVKIIRRKTRSSSELGKREKESIKYMIEQCRVHIEREECKVS